ncbi:acetyl-CoA carboxylase [Thermoanaerobacter sp. YS13]|uniref:acetyl-CoA carboxylase biotin carboxylase subunit n=1 Tax=Thermoanaerobacter sp. YS13 TaxID=1511746 RepID=UPI0005743146|nr:acetyl-CoA carboxylase biotin carboxylase subunit [Thermoanaerobacter sp. YS13]KHO62756.1 acetyl-CoA carboxylase [Thermoanaerobacter sp. YS13]
MEKVLIANRGEIAVRIIRACKELDIKTVAVYSTIDKNSLHVKYADEAHCIGPAEVNKSYMKKETLLEVARISKATAIHPGYGFLSEDPAFANLCQIYGVKWVGPPPSTMELVANKVKAKDFMRKQGIPVLLGFKVEGENIGDILQSVEEIRYPVIVKAVYGGGGRGIRVVYNAKDLKEAIEIAYSESQKVFGQNEVYLEKYLAKARHIEFQILADEYGNVIHLGERDCSLQRKYQKILEETPSPFLMKKPELREQMAEYAIKAAKAIGYVGAGTVEFIVDSQGNCYFMEINPRLQVEHGITELVTGIDIVKQQLKITFHEPLSLKQEDVKFIGHAIECRINAEDPDRGFKPSPGIVNTFIPPGGPKVRVDTAVYQGYNVPSCYDSLIAKIMAYGSDREEAIRVMNRALDEFIIEGISTTIPFHKKIINTSLFKKGEIYTDFVAKEILQ